MLSRKYSTQIYIRIKEQTQKIYDNNITKIIYNIIKLHNEYPLYIWGYGMAYIDREI